MTARRVVARGKGHEVAVALACLCVMSLAPTTALADHGERAPGSFACRAVAAIGQMGEVGATPAGADCSDADTSLGSFENGGNEVTLFRARTQQEPDSLGGAHPSDSDEASSESSVGHAVLQSGTNQLIVEAAAATALADCQPDGSASLSGTSRVTRVNVNGTEFFPSGQPQSIAVGPLATLHLNEQTTVPGNPNSLVRRAVRLETSSGDVIVGEAMAAVTGEPCALRRGTVTVELATDPADDPQPFSFGGPSPAFGTFGLDSDPATPEPVRRTGDLPAGAHEITQQDMPAGWLLDSIRCTDPDGGSSGDLGAATANVDVDHGEQITCTFTNVKLARLTVVQETDPRAEQDFAFHGPAVGQRFTLDDDDEPTLSDRQSFELAPGRYDVGQDDVPDYALESITCDDADSGGSVPLGAIVLLAAAENVTCTFRNALRPGGKVTVRLDADPNGPQQFAFTSPTAGIPDFVLDDDGDLAVPTAVQFAGLADGDYEFTQSQVGGWRLRSIDCSDPSGDTLVNPDALTATARVTGSELVECTFVSLSENKCPAGTVLNENGECVIVQTECPAGTQRVNDTCVVIRTTCPDGTVPDGAGNCVLVQTVCPGGTFRNSAGECVRVIRAPDPPRPPRGGPCARAGFGQFVALIGTRRRDSITGTNRSDRIYTLGGSDRVSGGRGNDCVDAGRGNDRIDGSNGGDLLLGRDGRDIINGGPNRDVIIGGNGHDKLIGGSGSDQMFGGRGRDKLSGGPGRDRLNGGDGRDYIEGGNGADTLIGGRGNDAINAATAGSGRDRVRCGPGFDTARVGADDIVSGCERVLVLRQRR